MLSFAQQRLWFLAQLDGGSEAYHLARAWRLDGPLDRAALVRALDALVTRHEALRTRLMTVDGEAFQRVDPPGAGFDLTVHDLPAEGVTAQAHAEARLAAIRREEAAEPFDLTRGPLTRGRLILLGPERHALLLTQHHIVSDGWSLGVLNRELGALYAAFRRGEPDPLPPLTAQYTDYAAWQRDWLSSGVLAEQDAYWRRVLADAPRALELPADRPRPAEQDYRGGYLPLDLGPELSAGLTALSRRHRGTLFTTVLTGWALVLSRLSGQTDLVLGLPTANRRRAELEGVLGLFVNTLALRLDLSGRPAVAELLRRVRNATLDALQRQDLPFERVVELVNPARSLTHTPLFQAMVAWQGDEPGLALPGLRVTPLDGPSPVAKFDLTLSLGERDGRIAGGLEYATALFDEATVARYGRYLRRVLEQLAAGPDRPVSELTLLDEDERRRLLVEWNGAGSPAPADATVHGLFEAQAARDPQAVALEAGDLRMTYGELNERANRLAGYLRRRGVRPDRLVGLCLERTPDTVVALLAVLKAGGAYLPLDPAYPAQRLAFLLADSAPVLVLTHAAARAALEAAGAGGPVVNLDADAAAWADLPATDPDPRESGVTPRQLAYAIYTSGSTGRPKGVLVEHGQLTAVAAAWQRLFGLRPGLAHLQLASFSFDVFTADVVRALGFGGRLVLCPRSSLLDPAALYALVRRCDFADIVPAALDALMDHVEAAGGDLAGLDTVVCGSDAWTLAGARRLRALCGPSVRIVHAYGVTEAAVDSACYELPADLAGLDALPIGRPLPPVRLYLLDAAGEPVPAGVPGEIHIGGAGVARGYLNRPELTAQRFLASPFLPGERLYRTGDLGRWRPDGTVEFLGRDDTQVKIRGFRVELGEIEARLAACPGVRDAVVVTRAGRGGARLVAYYRPAGGAAPDGDALRAWLAAALPEHMLPAAYVPLDAWPLTPNGKLDRDALPAPEAPDTGDAPGHVEPAGPLETALAALWAQVLGVERVGRHDDFFALGGHSLLAMRLVSRIRDALSREVPPTALFAAPTLAAFAERVAPDGQRVLPPIGRADRSAGPLPLSHAQQRLWFLAQLEGAGAAYHMPRALRLDGPLDRAALARALDALVGRHEVLRTRLVTVDGEPSQQVGPPDEGFALAVQELAVHDLAGQPEAALAAVQREEATAPFDLARGPLARGRLVVLGPDRHVLLLTLHHIVSDGWSMGVLTRELGALYAAFRRGGSDPLPPLPVQYADYAQWQRQWFSGGILAEQGAYWRDVLAGAPALLELPADRPRPAEQDYRGGHVPFELDADLTDRLNALSRRHGSTLYMTLLAAWALVLSRLSGQHDVVVGTPTANRRLAELDGLIGLFVNTLPVRVDLSGEPTVAELLSRVRRVTLAALEHQDVPFEQVVELVNPARSLAHAPLFQAMFAWQHAEDGVLALPGVEVTPLPSPWTVAKFDLTLSLGERDGRIAGSLEYAGALFDAGTVERYGGYLRRVLEQMAGHPDRRAMALDLMDGRERHRLLVEWNGTGCRCAEHTIPELFDGQVARDPHADAVTCEGRSLRYSELDERANRLAHHLVGLGVGPDRRVAVCLERSPDLVLALAAVLKAGGAYVPLDPDYPAERLAFMLSDSAPTLLLTQAGLRAALPAADVPVLCLDTDQAAWESSPAGSPPVTRLPDQLAYVIYTSGSTGRPKGVAQTWRAMDNMIHWQLRHATPDSPPPARVLQFASISFDVSFQEVWSTLCRGATLVLMAEGRRKELGELRRFIAGQGVRRAFLPFAVLKHIAALAGEGAGGRGPREPVPPAGGCEVVTAGEALQVDDELRALMAWFGGARLYNQYGPTETHVATQHTLVCADAGGWPALPPIGRQVANTRLYVLDAWLQPVPAGVVGELYIAGPSLARGYLGRPELTAERFLPDPFAPTPGERMYRTGDLVRWLADGTPPTLGYVGRADDQVKVRGFRVELGEVESVLRRVDGVREAAVLLREDTPGDRHLVGYLAGDVDVEQVRARLRRRLPEHMVPTRWVLLDGLPLTANGKLDRRSLPAPEAAAGEAPYVAPRTEREARLAAVWAEVLRRERVGVHDDFFALGGHSLLATRLVHAVNQRMAARLTLRDLFRHPVLADLATVLGHGEAEEALPPLTPDPDGRHEPFPLTDIQQAYWVGRESTIELGGIGAHAYREIRLREFDEDRFTAALNRLIARHDMLRSVFHPDGTQQVLEDLPVYRMPRQDLRGLDRATVARRLAETRERMSHQVFDASRWPLFEFAVTLLDGPPDGPPDGVPDGVPDGSPDSAPDGARDSAGGPEVRLHVSTDALVVDAASSQILERELVGLYEDPDASLPPLGLTFRDYVLAERALRDTPRYERALRYWRERATTLAPAPALPLVRQPEDVQRPRFTRYDHVLPAERWRGLKAIAQRHGVTPSVLLLTAFSQVLALWSRRPRFTLSLPLFNRLPLHPHINAVIGDFTSLVLLEVEADPGAPFVAQARAVQERLWQDIDHSAVSGVRVVRELARARGTRQTAMPVVFNSTLSELTPGLDERSFAAKLGGESVHTITQTPQVWIDHTVLELEGRLHFNWDSIDELFPDGLVGEMFAAYRGVLERLEDPAAWPAAAGALLPAFAAPPAPAADEPGPLPLLHELFERQALATPGAVAVISPDRRLSYGELRREARALAARLQRRGVRQGELVALLADRGWEQVVGALAVLYAGAAYLPVDPALPAERIAHLLDRSRSRLALVQPAQPALPLPGGVEPVVIEGGSTGPGAVDDVEFPHSGGDDVTSSPLAYVIYTSGSTGTPKGVVIDHRGAVNTLLDVNERFRVGPDDRVLAISSLSFDLSVYDIFGTLAAGGAVVTLEPELARDPAHWLELLQAHRVSVWNSVPALLGLLVEYAESQPGTRLPPCLRLAMLSGDWIPVALPDRLRSLLPGAEVHSLGGATEASIWSIHHPIGEVDPSWRSIPYGRAMKHQRFHVLDGALRPRPTWVPGELYIGGAGLARGYWRDEARTAASFVTHPVTGERLYRTGDLGRWLPDGTIEFLGREDGQVKVHGYRVELGEIEAVLEGHPAVRAAAVRLLGEAHGDKRLAAYAVAPGVDARELARHLGRRLPAYMVPASFTFLDALPLSANGKVDRGRLPEPAPDASADAGPAAEALELAGPAEARLVEIVEGILGRDGIAPRANLLLLGATSIDIVRIGNALSSELGFRPRLVRLMLQPTIADLLDMYREHGRQRAIAETARQAAARGARDGAAQGAAAQGAAAQGAAARAAVAAGSGDVVDDPRARAAFKARGEGRRRFDGTPAAVPLAVPDDPASARRYADYRSVRRFGPGPVAGDALAGLLACLAQRELGGQPKYLYGSAGGAYPVQAYLYVKRGRVDGVPGGAYYYDPHLHRLVAVGSGQDSGRELSPDAYDYFVNRPVFEAAAFALFLVAELAAIEPLYGEQSLGFCQIEAGAMAQLLTMVAAERGLGLCGIGSVEAGHIDPLFELGPTHRLVYSLVGGVRPGTAVPVPAAAVEMDDVEI